MSTMDADLRTDSFLKWEGQGTQGKNVWAYKKVGPF